MPEHTVELPADPDIKQLANDIAREENEEFTPYVLDFYKFISNFEKDEEKTRSDLRVEDPESNMPPGNWGALLNDLVAGGVIEEHQGADVTYTWK